MNLTPNQDKQSQPLGALIAPLAGIGTFVLVMVPCFSAFSNNKTAMPLSFFVAAAAGIFIGRLCYNNSQPTNDELAAVASDKQNDSIASTLWASGLAFSNSRLFRTLFYFLDRISVLSLLNTGILFGLDSTVWYSCLWSFR